MSKKWTFLGHHAHVLIALDENPDYKIEELAQILGVTTRSVVNVLNDLVEGGYLIKTKDGRRNHYEINRSAELRHLTSANKTVGDLIEYLGKIH
ncbi:MAG: MarR family transcriptional regulator [Actinobacteria bacterium]|nr:MarR family transcriptional regulator [Actinomycetota bacterium]